MLLVTSGRLSVWDAAENLDAVPGATCAQTLSSQHGNTYQITDRVDSQASSLDSYQ
jgi:hypothetical protein